VLAQGRDLSAGQGGTAGLSSDLLHKGVGGGGEQDPKLVGPEARATGAVELQTVMQFFDTVLDFAA
jgi:hypothetical protein